MSAVRFLCDEHVAFALIRALFQRSPAIDVLRVGQPGAPPFGTKDPALLLAAETDERALITTDRRTMIGHITAHLAAGHHTWGVLLIRRKARSRAVVDDLFLIWSASQADEWRDRIDWIPF